MSLLDLLGLNRIFKAGTEIKPTRKILNFIGDGVTITDDEANERTNITIAAGSEGGEGTVTGPETSTVGRVVTWNSADGTVLADGGVALADLATAQYVDNAIAALPVGGDVVGPATAVDARIAAFDGTSGNLLKDGGKSIAEVEASAVATANAYTDANKGGWKVACDINFSTLANQTIVDGANVIDGKTWTGVNIASGSDLFAIVNGSGLEMSTGAANVDAYMSARTAPHIKIPLSTLLGSDASMMSEIRMWIAQDVVNPTNGIEAIQCGLYDTTFSVNGRIIRSFNGNVSGTVLRWHESAVGGAAANVNYADVDEVVVLHLKAGHLADTMETTVLTRAQSLAAPVSWPNSNLLTRRQRLATNNAGWSSLSDVCFLITVVNINSLNNAAFKGITRRLRVEYRP